MGKSRAYDISSLGKEKLPKEWKVKVGRKNCVNFKNMANQVFNNLDENMAMPGSNVAIEQLLDSKCKSYSPVKYGT